MADRQPIKWRATSDEEFLSAAEMQIWLSAFASNNPRAPAHAEADAAYAEAARRGKPWLYQRAWNKAYAFAGHRPSDQDLAAAEPEHRRTTEAE